jgi:transcriptional regulator with XRE-family HTH domain
MMIRNERQYRIAGRERKQLADALDELLAGELGGQASEGDDPFPDQVTLRLQLAQASLAGQIADLDMQLRDYEVLRAGALETVVVASLTDLSDALVRARIASGLTQRELAERLGLKEQQVQRYESEGYASASLSRLQQVMTALGLQLEAGLELPPRDTPLSRLRGRLVQLGLSKRVVDQRFLRDVPPTVGAPKVLELAERAARLLGIPTQLLLGDATSLPALATTGRFKAARNAAHVPLDIYTRYAEGVAEIVLRATSQLGTPKPPGHARSVREAIEERCHLVAPALDEPTMRSDVLLMAALQYAYDLGIPVLALRDPGVFHGACFTASGRSVIVLKQTTNSAARWLGDLLHELDHIGDPARGGFRSWIELGDVSEWSTAPEEQHANAFAADVLFSGRAEAVLSRCLTMARGSVQQLKEAVPRVAAEAGVPTDVLANYLAYRLTERGINWWPTAATLQEPSTPWHLVSDMLLRRLDLTVLDAPDRAILIDVLAGSR